VELGSIPVAMKQAALLLLPMGVPLAYLRDPPPNFAPPPRLQDFLVIYFKNPKDGP
jgi:hypothetical protein